VEPLVKSLHKSKIHPYYIFPFKDRFSFTEFDLLSGWKTKDSNYPDKIFNHLINDSKKSPDEVVIFTDVSKTRAPDGAEGANLVGCAILIPYIKSYAFKLNPLTNSFMAETLAIDKTLQIVDSYSWP